MKMNLHLSFDEGQTMLDNLYNCALQHGWDEEEVEASDVLEEYCDAVDAALASMGISLTIQGNPVDVVEKDDDDDDEMTYDEFMRQLKALIED